MSWRIAVARPAARLRSDQRSRLRPKPPSRRTRRRLSGRRALSLVSFSSFGPSYMYVL
ncbi:MAG: hypothetical protein MI923_17320 [Phycisphaerales bacterium]|nr:hypothetical protein [Phycisphaerales bacterium]